MIPQQSTGEPPNQQGPPRPLLTGGQRTNRHTGQQRRTQQGPNSQRPRRNQPPSMLLPPTPCFRLLNRLVLLPPLNRIKIMQWATCGILLSLPQVLILNPGPLWFSPPPPRLNYRSFHIQGRPITLPEVLLVLRLPSCELSRHPPRVSLHIDPILPCRTLPSAPLEPPPRLPLRTRLGRMKLHLFYQ